MCFREAPLFLGITANARCTSLLLHSVRSEAFPLHPVPVNISHKARAVPSSGKDVVVAIRRPGIRPWLCPSWRGTLDECLCSWAFLSSPVKQRGQNWIGVFPMIPSGFIRGRGRGSPGEALDGQALASLFSPPGRPTFGVDALFDSIPVGFRDSKFIEEVTCKNTPEGRLCEARAFCAAGGQGAAPTGSVTDESRLRPACRVQ